MKEFKNYFNNYQKWLKRIPRTLRRKLKLEKLTPAFWKYHQDKRRRRNAFVDPIFYLKAIFFSSKARKLENNNLNLMDWDHFPQKNLWKKSLSQIDADVPSTVVLVHSSPSLQSLLLSHSTTVLLSSWTFSFLTWSAWERPNKTPITATIFIIWIIINI